MQSPTISTPLKKTDEVDWSTPIRSAISNSYGESPDNYATEIGLLQRCRQDAVRGAGSDNTARDLLYKYFGQLELLELRFAEVKVSFPWYDAFTSKLTTQTSLAFEKACVIFQMAAVHSSLASSQSRASPEGVKRAFYYFRTSAGLFTYINENFLHAPSTDLSKEVIKLLTGIMMAQATEVFWERLRDDKKGDALVGKVAAQASSLYTGLTEEVKEFMGRGIFDRNWVSLLQIKAKYFTSVAHYYRSLVEAKESQHGASLSRLILSETLAKEANRLCNSFAPYALSSYSPSLPADASSSIIDITKAHLAIVTAAREQASRDNDLIYNAILPNEAALPVLDKLSVATPVPIHEIYAAPDVQAVIGADFFSKLVPMGVHESASVYSEEKAKLVRAESARVIESDDEAELGLRDLGVIGTQLARWREWGDGGSGAAATMTGEEERERYEAEVRSEEDKGTIRSMMAELETLRANVGDDLQSISRELEIESRDCEQMRVKYEHLWSQAPSASLTKPLRTRLKENQDAFASASTSDGRVFSLWTSIEPDVGALLSGRPLPGASDSNVRNLSLVDTDLGNDEEEMARDEVKRKVKDIEEKVGRLNKVRRERAEVLKDLKEKVQNDDVSHLLLLNRRSQPGVESALFTAELEKFRPYQARISATLASQEQLMGEITEAWRDLTSGRRAREWARKWEEEDRKVREVGGKARRVRETYGEVREGLGKGLHFYRELKDLVAGLRRDVFSFTKGRAVERETLASQLETQRRLTGLSSTPLPRPPPPPSTYSMEKTFGSMSLSDAGMPPRPPPPPNPQTSWPSTAPPMSPIQTQASAYPSFPPPPPSRPPVTSPPPPAPPSDPYAGMFGASSPFSTGPTNPPPPPHQRQPQRQQSYPPPPQQASHYPPPPAPRQPSAYPPPPQQSQSSYAPSPAPPAQSSYAQPSQSYQYSPGLPPPPPAPASYQSSQYSSGTPGPMQNEYQYRPPYSQPPPPPPQQQQQQQQQQQPRPPQGYQSPYGSGPPPPGSYYGR